MQLLLQLDASYITDPCRQQAVELKTVFRPVDIMHCRASSKAFWWALVSLDTPLKQCCRMEMHFNPGATNQYRQQTPAIPQHILMQFQSVIIKYIDSGCFWRLRVWPCFWIAYFLWKKTKLFRSTWTYPALSDVLQGPRLGACLHRDTVGSMKPCHDFELTLFQVLLFQLPASCTV